MSFLGDIVGDIGSAVSSVANTVEGVASGALNTVEGLAGGAVKTAEGLAGGALNTVEGLAGDAFKLASPLLGGALGPLGGILGGLLGNSSQQSVQPFSQLASGISPNLFTSQSDLAATLGSATNTLNNGLDSIDPSSLSSLESTANAAEAKAQQTGSVADELSAQQAMEKLQMAASTMSNIMSIYTNMDKSIIDNFRAQG